MSDLQKNRDFIDFLTLLYYKKIQFLIILLLFVGAGVYFNQSLNNAYKFEVELHVASLDNFYESDNFQRQVNLALNLDLNRSGMDMKTLNSFTWSNDQAKAFLQSLNVNGDFFYGLATLYSSDNDIYELKEEIMSSASYKQSGGYGMDITFELDDKELANFLQLNFVNYLVDYTSDKLKKHMVRMKGSALDLFENKAKGEINNIKKSKSIFWGSEKMLAESDDIGYINRLQLYSLSDEELDKNYLDYSSFGERYSLIKSMKVPTDKIQLYRYISSSLKDVKKISTIFLFILVVFASLFMHTFISILEDLRMQIIERNSQ